MPTSTDRDKRLEYQGVVVPILRYLNSLPRSKAVNVHGGIYTERGTPDVIGAVGGRMVAFECKRSRDEEPTRIQQWRLAVWLHAGAVVGAVADVSDVEMILRLMGVVE